MPTRPRPLAPLLVLLALLLAAPAPGGAAPLGESPFLARLWRLVSSVWAEEGCGLDPNGRCGALPNLEAGCGLDPNGRCGTVAPTRPEGCGLDPNGRCGAEAPAREEGCGLDPDGRCRP